MGELTWDEFQMVELRSGTIISVDNYPEARNPAYIITVDFGEKIGIKKTSAQVTDLYKIEDLLGKQITAVVNFPKKQIGKFMSEFLLVGFIQEDSTVVLAVPDKKIDNGLRLG